MTTTREGSSDTIFLGTMSEPATVVKLRAKKNGLSFHFAATATLRANENSITALFFDDSSRMLWCACSTPRGLPAHVVVLRGDDLSRETSVTLHPRENSTISAMVASRNGMMYLALASTPPHIVEVTRGGFHRTRGAIFQAPSHHHRNHKFQAIRAMILAPIAREQEGQDDESDCILFASLKSGHVLKILVTEKDISLVHFVSLGARNSPAASLAIDFGGGGGVLYAATYGTASRLFRIPLPSSFEEREHEEEDDGDVYSNSTIEGTKLTAAHWFYRLVHVDSRRKLLFVISEDASTSTLTAVSSESGFSHVADVALTAGDRVAAAAVVKTTASDLVMMVTASVPPKIVTVVVVVAEDGEPADQKKESSEPPQEKKIRDDDDL